MPNNLRKATNQTALQGSFALADAVVYKSYLDHLDEIEVMPCPEDLQGRDINSITWFLKLSALCTRKRKQPRQADERVSGGFAL